MRALAILLFLLLAAPAIAGVERDLKRMVGFTVMHAGVIIESTEKNFSEKFLRLDNGWVFKLDCLMLTPLNMTDVIVFGKKIPEEVIKKVPNLPAHLTYQFKLLIDRDVCDASLTK